MSDQNLVALLQDPFPRRAWRARGAGESSGQRPPRPGDGAGQLERDVTGKLAGDTLPPFTPIMT
jgi:hypothetical protein